MREPPEHPALLSKAQLDLFRSQLEARREAEFLAPQLLEQVVILTRDLRIALGRVETLRAGLAEIEQEMVDLLGGDEAGHVRAELSTLLARVRVLLPAS